MKLEEFYNYLKIKTDTGFKEFSESESELFCKLVKNNNFNYRNSRNIMNDLFYIKIVGEALINGKTLIIASLQPERYINKLKEVFADDLIINGNSVTLKQKTNDLQSNS